MIARFEVWFAVPDPDSLVDLGQRIFDFLAADPDDLFPEIETVEDYLIGQDR